MALQITIIGDTMRVNFGCDNDAMGLNEYLDIINEYTGPVVLVLNNLGIVAKDRVMKSLPKTKRITYAT